MSLNKIDHEQAVFTVSVNYEDPRWRSLDVRYVPPSTRLTVEHYPIKEKGTAEIAIEYATFDREMEILEVLDAIRQKGLRVPDRAETESFLDQYDDEQRGKCLVISLCGLVVDRRGSYFVAGIDIDTQGRSRQFSWFGGKYTRWTRYLAVRK